MKERGFGCALFRSQRVVNLRSVKIVVNLLTGGALCGIIRVVNLTVVKSTTKREGYNATDIWLLPYLPPDAEH